MVMRSHLYDFIIDSCQRRFAVETMSVATDPPRFFPFRKVPGELESVVE